MFSKSNICSSTSDLLVKQSDSTVSKNVLVFVDYLKVTVRDVNEDAKVRVLCQRASANKTNSSETSTSSMSSKTGLYLAIGTSLVLLIGVPSILFGVEPIKVSLTL